ncbi:hypothetical protein RQM47_08760 [Rubrivirga sp. S365]|uniref:Uncharacterized protein n=1 Tax=Rubrivirga litoralis TaxID=3075598 RepID=A0ABU3BTG8_9BACT|nr:MULTISPECIES: hypothetical protein [unclassified Rubrivirga]MDT0632582.1 hypothetical protein [Rubrivirga sp. F394]MDT7856728.1 hypothetical protein [Rubrivirga sp. S365]
MVDLLQRQRSAARAAEALAEIGPRVPPRPPRPGGAGDPHLAAYAASRERRQAASDLARRAHEARADSAIRVARMATLRWEKVRPREQGPFLEQYGEAFWLSAPTGGAAAIDTTSTAVLRGQLQAAFGDPTRNGDAQKRYGYGGSDHVQFEYWFAVNDTIPVLVLDLDGPFGRGLMIAADEEQAAFLPALKADLARRLAAERRPVPWLDYYHSFARRTWYRTGYNGTEFYVREVRPPRWAGAAGDRWIIHR